MSNTLKHGFTSAKADDVDTSLIQPSHWNAEHTFAGGALGSLLYRDTGATDGANWLADVAAGSVLVSGGVGAAPAFSATPSLTDLTLTGVLKAADGLVGAPGYAFSADLTTGLFRGAASDLRVTLGGTARFRFSTAGVRVMPTDSIAWGSTDVTNPDVFLFRDGAAAILAQRNGTNAQLFRIYGTFTDSSNYERLEVGYDSTNTRYVVQSASAGTGTNRNLNIGTNGSAELQVRTNGSTRWRFDANGHMLAATDNSFDIGASGATRPRNIFAAGTGTFSGSLSTGGALVFTSNGRISFQSDGVFTLFNAAQTDFTRLQFGGTTSAFPALKRSGTGIAVRLADDSADAGLTAASITTSATTLHTTSAALTNGAGVATGTLTNAPAAGNPTKWIPINDNGTTRYIPAW